MNTPQSKKWAVLIGINQYHESLGELRFCLNDARLMEETLLSPVCGFEPENVLSLTEDSPPDRQPTFGNIHSWLGSWLAKPAANDTLLLYFAGHGREQDGSTLLAPVDSTLETLHVTGIPIHVIHGLLQRCKARRKALVLDACHSGAGRDVAAVAPEFQTELQRAHGIYTLASCGADQVSHEWREKEHGAFTYFLADAIRSSCPADADGTVTLDRVYQCTHRSVTDWASSRRLRQEPLIIKNASGELAIAHRVREQVAKQVRLDDKGVSPSAAQHDRGAGPPSASGVAAHEPAPFVAAGSVVECPHCEMEFYNEVVGGVECPDCSESFTVGPDSMAVGSTAECPHCEVEFYNEVVGGVECPDCNASFTLGPDSRAVGSTVECPHCGVGSYFDSVGEIECQNCNHQFLVDENLGWVGRTVECPACAENFFNESVGLIECPSCSKQLAMGDDCRIEPSDVECPCCRRSFYHVGSGEVECPDCGELLSLDEDGQVMGCAVECPHCEEDLYIERVGKLECPDCNEEFSVGEDGQVVGCAVECPECSTEFYNETPGQIECPECGFTFTVRRQTATGVDQRVE